MPSDDDGEILAETLLNIQTAIEQASDKLADRAKAKVDATISIFEKAKDNIAWLLGLPTAIGGAFGFLWESSAEEASLTAQVAQLEEAVADLKAQGDLLGGGAKNWSLDPSAAPGGSMTLILAAAAVITFISLLFWYQNKRKKR